MTERDRTTAPARRRWPRRLALGLGVLVILAVGIPFAYIHLVEGKAPAKLSLQQPSTAEASGPLTLAGTWHVGAGSVVGYRVNEVLVGQHTTAVGRTSAVTGQLSFTGTTLSSASFTTQMARVRSDQSRRDEQFRGRIMDTSTYPTSTFTLSSPVDVGTGLGSGATVAKRVTGQLQLHGQTHPVTFTLDARHVGTGIDVQAEIPVTFASWGIANPSFGSFVRTDDHGILELLLHLAPGASSANSTNTTTTAGAGTGPGPGGGGGGAPVTVPATTTPSLTLPN